MSKRESESTHCFVIIVLFLADGRDIEIAKLRSELESARAESEKRIEGLKRQQGESKSKAKAVIQRQGEELRKKIQTLEEDARLRGDELLQVKHMLRHAEDERTALETQADVLKNENRTLTSKVGSIETRLDAAEKERLDSDQSLSKMTSERDGLQSQVTDLQQQLELKQQQQQQIQSRAAACEGVR